MKHIYILLSIFFIALLLSGCKEKKEGIEIVPNLDAMYLPSNEVDTPANGGKDFKSRMERDLVDAVKSLNYSHRGFTVIFPVTLRLYINENGEIDKIKDLSPIKTKTQIPDSVQIYPHRNKLDQAIASKLAGWKFKPAKKNGENVKYRTDISFNTIENSHGIYSHSMLISLDNMSSTENEFFVAVEQMPEPIGGIAGIQKRIHYPEIAKRAGIEGRVYVLAFIDDKGNVVKARVLKGIGGGCDQVALKAVEETKFTPGRQRGKAVNVQVTVPVVFKLH